jgi:hypothetical protein
MTAHSAPRTERRAWQALAAHYEKVRKLQLIHQGTRLIPYDFICARAS